MFSLQLQENRLKLRQFAAALGFLLFASVTATMAQQTTTFAVFEQDDIAAKPFVFDNTSVNSSTPSGTFNTVGGGAAVLFRYANSIVGLPTVLRGSQDAILTLTSDTTVGATNTSGANLTQPINGSFTIAIIRTTPAGVGANSQRNLLTVTVSQATSTADIVGSGGSVTYSASDSALTPPRGQIVTYTSDFLDFTQTNARNISLQFTSVTPAPLSQGTANVLSDFTTSGGGSFASNPIPFYQPPTSASVNVGGRVLNTSGRGLKGAQVSLTDGAGAVRTTVTNSFGYYNFNEVAAGQTVIVAVTAKRYIFNSQVVSVSEELTGLNFTALD